jgi:hypothetical protein
VGEAFCVVRQATKRNIVLGFAGLAIGHIRYVLQYGRFPYASVLEFFGAWFIHYIWLSFVIAIAYGFSHVAGGWVFGPDYESKKISIEQALVYFAVAILVAVVSMLIISAYPESYDEY